MHVNRGIATLMHLNRSIATLSWTLAFATEQGGLIDWLFLELVGTPPLSARCCFSGGSGVLKEPEESVIWIKDSSGSRDEPISTDEGIMVLGGVIESIRLITCRTLLQTGCK